MTLDAITPDMEIQDLLMWQFLQRIVTHNQGKVVTKAIKVPLVILKLPCGCVREYGTPLWQVSIVDASGAPLPEGHVRHEFAGTTPCDKVFAVRTPHSVSEQAPSFSVRLREVIQKEKLGMQSAFELVDELASEGKLGPDVVTALFREGYDASDVVEALRQHSYEVHTQFGNEVHLRGVSDYPRGHRLYTPLQRRDTGELALATTSGHHHPGDYMPPSEAH